MGWHVGGFAAQVYRPVIHALDTLCNSHFRNRDVLNHFGHDVGNPVILHTAAGSSTASASRSSQTNRTRFLVKSSLFVPVRNVSVSAQRRSRTCWCPEEHPC